MLPAGRATGPGNFPGETVEAGATRILVVEDEFITATDIQIALVGMGYDVPALVDNGEEAIRKAGELHPTLILMDIGLAGKMSGIEAAKQIYEDFKVARPDSVWKGTVEEALEAVKTELRRKTGNI